MLWLCLCVGPVSWVLYIGCWRVCVLVPSVFYTSSSPLLKDEHPPITCTNPNYRNQVRVSYLAGLRFLLEIVLN